MISVNSTQRAFADYIVAVQCGILLVLWSDPQKVPAMALEERATTALAERWAGLAPLAVASVGGASSTTVRQSVRVGAERRATSPKL